MARRSERYGAGLSSFAVGSSSSLGAGCCDRPGSKFKAVNNRDKNSRSPRSPGGWEQSEGQTSARYLRALDQADREESEVAEAKSVRLKEKIAGLRRQMHALKVMEQTVQDAPDQQVSLTDPDARSMATSAQRHRHRRLQCTDRRRRRAPSDRGPRR